MLATGNFYDLYLLNEPEVGQMRCIGTAPSVDVIIGGAEVSVEKRTYPPGETEVYALWQHPF